MSDEIELSDSYSSIDSEPDFQQLKETLGFNVVDQHDLEVEAKTEIQNKIDLKEKKRKEREEIRLSKLNKKNKFIKQDKNQNDEVEKEFNLEIFGVEEVLGIDDKINLNENKIEIVENQISLNSIDDQLEPSTLNISTNFEDDLSDEEDTGLESEGSEYLPEDDIKVNRISRKVKNNLKVELETSDEELDELNDSKRSIKNNNEMVKDNKSSVILDDSDISNYRIRVRQWAKLKASHRKEPIEGNETTLPHPLYPDVDFDDGLKMPGEIHTGLMDYQKTGVKWFWNLYKFKHGGVLADEMGLGKTIQTIGFLASLYYSSIINRPSLIICPATLTQQWVYEFQSWWSPLRIINLHQLKTKSNSSSRREHPILQSMTKFFKSNTIFITSYEGAASYGREFARLAWGVVVLDEGHKISNPDTKVSKACKLFKTPYRYILSGTPIQNKLKELWSIYDFVRPGLLGTLEEFDKRIAKSIELNGSKGKDIYDKQIAVATAKNLRSVIQGNLLRRMKSDVAKEIPTKTEQVIYCKLHQKQRRAYISYLDSYECQEILKDKRNHMVGISTLRKICNHPDLTFYRNQEKVEHYGHYRKSGKTRVLDGLLNLWKKEGHRTLIFCQTIQMQEILTEMSFFKENGFLFMNGSTPVSKRMALVDEFNTNKSLFAFILTTRTGGQGLNLTGADRVVIFDPDWNPSADLQALSRAWRLGQSKKVCIYRLISKGTIEQRVHHLQLYKQILSDRILKDPQQKLLFRNHFNDLFAYPPEDEDEVIKPNTIDNNQASIEEAKLAIANAELFQTKEESYKVVNENKDESNEDNSDMLMLIGIKGNESQLSSETQKLQKSLNKACQEIANINLKKLQEHGQYARQLQLLEKPNGSNSIKHNINYQTSYPNPSLNQIDKATNNQNNLPILPNSAFSRKKVTNLGVMTLPNPKIVTTGPIGSKSSNQGIRNFTTNRTNQQLGTLTMPDPRIVTTGPIGSKNSNQNIRNFTTNRTNQQLGTLTMPDPRIVTTGPIGSRSSNQNIRNFVKPKINQQLGTLTMPDPRIVTTGPIGSKNSNQNIRNLTINRTNQQSGTLTMPDPRIVTTVPMGNRNSSQFFNKPKPKFNTTGPILPPSTATKSNNNQKK